MRFSRSIGPVVVAVLLVSVGSAPGADVWGLKSGKVELKSAGPLAFGPDGILLVGDPTATEVVAIATDDAKASPSAAELNISGFQQKLDEAVGGQAKVIDLAVNPDSHNIYLSVSHSEPSQPAIVRVYGLVRMASGSKMKITTRYASFCSTL